jgi:pimeloyl-ACP methyl ester carboxylesterase
MKSSPENPSHPTHPRTVFLHWGPGGNVEIELEWFRRYPAPPYLDQSTHFWKQDFADGRIHFSALLIQTEKLIKEALTQGPLQVCAHSFGAQILMRLHPDLIRQLQGLTIIGAAPNLQKGFAQLAAKLALVKSDETLLELSRQFLNSSQPSSHFQALVGGVTRHPDFLALYWGRQSSQAFNTYLEIISQHPPFDFEVFMKVMTDFFETETAGAIKPIHTDFLPKMILGTDDPFLSIPEDSENWKQIFPQAEISLLPVGHFPHFETSLV